MSNKNETPREAGNRTILTTSLICLVLTLLTCLFIAATKTGIVRKIATLHACQITHELLDAEWLCINDVTLEVREPEDESCAEGEKTYWRVPHP